MIALTVASIVLPLAAQLAEAVYKQWQEQRAVQREARRETLRRTGEEAGAYANVEGAGGQDDVVAQVLRKVEAATPALTGVEKRAVFVQALKALADKTGDARLDAAAAVGEASVDAIVAEANAGKANAGKGGGPAAHACTPWRMPWRTPWRMQTPKTAHKTAHKARAPPLVRAPCVVALANAGMRAQEHVAAARTRLGPGQQLAPSVVLALVPDVLRALGALGLFAAAPPQQQAALADRVLRDIAAAAPAAERAAWERAAAGARPTVLALAYARAGTLWNSQVV